MSRPDSAGSPEIPEEERAKVLDKVYALILSWPRPSPGSRGDSTRGEGEEPRAETVPESPGDSAEFREESS